MKRTYYTLDVPKAFTKLWKIERIFDIDGFRLLIEQFCIPIALTLNKSEYKAASSSLKMFDTQNECLDYCVTSIHYVCKKHKTTVPEICSKAKNAIEIYRLIVTTVLNYYLTFYGK